MIRAPLGPKGVICPLHKKSMHLVCHKCAWYMQLRGLDRNTGQEIDDWNCAIPRLVRVGIEGSQMGRETGAAVESFRNVMVKLNSGASNWPERLVDGSKG